MPAVSKETGIQLLASYSSWAAPPHPRYTEGKQQEQWVAEIRNAFLVQVVLYPALYEIAASISMMLAGQDKS